MGLDLKDSFDKSCRLCAKVQDVTLMIFSLEAEAMFFQHKLSKYLLLKVERDDNLPKNICIDCCSKLYSVCDFIDTVHESQKSLLNLRILLDTVDTPVCENIQSAKEPTNITKQIIEKDDSDLAPLYGLDGENVTIKLINEREYLKNNYCEEIEMSEHWKVHSKNIPSNILNDGKHNKNMNKGNICCICKKEFVKKSNLIKHQRVHNNNINCQDCGKHFRTTANLRSHMVMHIIKKVSEYACNICGKHFNTLGGLKAHNVTHISARPFGCKVCKKTFKRNHELKSHMNNHTGSRPFQCVYCDKAFSSSTNCYVHRRRKHPEHFKEKREGKRNYKNNVDKEISIPTQAS